MRTISGINDTITIQPAGYFIPGTDGNDGLYGTAYADTMHGYGGNDLLSGGGGNDTIYGDAGNDTLYGGTGNDVLDGGVGDDYLVGGAGADQLIGGDGFDTVSYIDSSLGVTVDLTSGSRSNDSIGDTYVSIEKFVGSNYGDFFNGDAGNNIFDGGAGDDWLFGQAGNDTLTGGAGDDHLVGGDGNDVLIGGQGNNVLTGDGSGTHGFDTFVISAGGGTDTITDFDMTFDHLGFSGFGSQPYGADNHLAWGYFDNNQNHWVTYNLDGTDKVFYDTARGALVDMNANLAYAMQHNYAIGADVWHTEATFSNHASLSVSDFSIFA